MKVKFVYTPEWEEITAVFVDECGGKPMPYLLCYSHIGQHSGCSWEWAKQQQPATLEQYAPLLEELKSIYNDLEIV